jgi:hypothetical protein
VNFTFVTIPNLVEGSWWLPYLGPGATVFAAVVAGWLAYRLQRLQAAIGKSQIEVAEASKEAARVQTWIAFDKLKLDLFNRRFDVYTEALKIAADTWGSPSAGSGPVTYERLDKLHEAAFIFSEEAAKRIEIIRAAAENILVYSAHLKKLKQEGKQEGSLEVEAQNDLILTQRTLLMSAAADLRQWVKPDLSFNHLLPKTPDPSTNAQEVEGRP